jgi:CubicO group peptidase (beta-lactamase class C family)
MVIAKGRRFVTLILLTLASPCLAAHLEKGEVDELAAPVTKSFLVKGCVIGVIEEKGRQVYGYGLTTDGGVRPDGKTVYEIGSISKTFTATLLALMVKDGTVRLDQPVQELLPAGVKMPIKDDVPITLEQMTTHMSGLPRLPENWNPADVNNPYADYGSKNLYEGLASLKLAHKPNLDYEYSNLAVGLLGQVLALKAGTRYEQLLVDRICTPLGMNDTRITLDDRLKARLAHGYVGQTPVASWDFDALAGAGGIRSTADDMLNYVAAEIGLVDSPLAPAMKLTQEVHFKMTTGKTDTGMVWNIGRRTGARYHGGQTGGYRCFVAFVPEKKIGVVILSNSSTTLIEQVGTRLIEAMLR